MSLRATVVGLDNARKYGKLGLAGVQWYIECTAADKCIDPFVYTSSVRVNPRLAYRLCIYVYVLEVSLRATVVGLDNARQYGELGLAGA